MSKRLMFLVVLFSWSSVLCKITTKKERQVPIRKSWENHKAIYGLKFEPEEEIKRRQIFMKNLMFVKRHNIKGDGLVLKMNKFGHLTPEEFAEMYLSKSFDFIPPAEPKIEPIMPVTLPRDWRKEGVVNPVRDQGQCGSCWAFSSISAVESAIALKSKELLKLSEQELVDCSSSFGNMGCNGGMMIPSFNFIKKYGITSRNDYKYTAKNGDCHKGLYKVIANVTGHTSIPAADENALTDAIVHIGPVSVAIDASDPMFQFYSSGIFYSTICKSSKLNHAVVAVGVNDDHYIVRNSWGEAWGDEGYIKMSRNRDNNCGIASYASYPLA